MTLFYLLVFVASLLLGLFLTRRVRNLANARGWVSSPELERHLHIVPLPRLGGVAIFIVFFLTVGVALLVVSRFPHRYPVVPGRTVLTILCAGILVFLLGAYDDMRTVGPYIKFAVQGIAATILFAGGMRIFNLPVLFGHHEFTWMIGLPLTILWVLAVTNAFNLIDGLDGLAAGSALFSTMVVFVVALLSGSFLVSLMTLALAGAILGFLRFNFNPATIFLGDCGSLFIGFMLSALALQGAQKSPTIIAVAIPVVSFGLPILETALSVVRRLIAGRPVFTGDREHIHHKLLQLGFSHREVVITLYAVSALFALLSLFLLWPTGSTLGLVLAVVGTGVWMGVQHLGYIEFGELRRMAHRTMEQRQIVINNLAFRRAIEELKVSCDYDQICRVLVAAFESNDFDVFELRPSAQSSALLHGLDANFRWTKAGSRLSQPVENMWSLHLDLLTANNRHYGSLSVYRLYKQHDLQFDINLLVSGFPVALAESLGRVSRSAIQVLDQVEPQRGLAAAQSI